MTPDLDLARRFVATQPIPGRLILCGVTGSHQYGFTSGDSDIDLKGIYLDPPERILGLGAEPRAFDRLEVFEGVECDLTLHEVRQALTLLLRGNGNVLERILSPFQLVEGTEQGELRELARASVSRRFFGHYAGYLRGMCREHDRAPRPTAKRLLYAYRVALTGTHLLRTGELEADLEPLARRYGYPAALELMETKRASHEKVYVSASLDSMHRKAWPRLEAGLLAARDASDLPERAANADAIEHWLVSLRLAGLRDSGVL